jgi:hypothetical protein
MRMMAFVLFAVPLACTDSDADRVANARASTTSPAVVSEQHGNPNSAAATKAFQDRIAAYIALRNKVESTVPQLTETSDPNKIAARERALGEALIKSRPNAKPGDYFVKEYVPVLEQIIKADFAKRTPAERKALIVELPKGMKFSVNQIYPTTIPLATFPGNLLKELPELPKELEYRIVYRHVILLDVEGNYVVDMVPNVFPIPM